MTISQQDWEKDYLADGVYSGPYGIPFPFDSIDHIKIFVVNADGQANPRSGVTIEKFQDQSGGRFFITGAPPPAGTRVRVERVVPLEQTLDLEARSTLQPEVFERALDRKTMTDQELKGRLLRLVGLPDVPGLRGVNLPKPQGNFLLGWNPNGSGFKNFDPSQFIGAVGPQGPQGPPGPQGPAGAGVRILGSLEDPLQLASISNPQPGDAYLIEGDLYVRGTSSWQNVGNIQGPQGPPGPQGPAGDPGSGAGVNTHKFLLGLSDDDHLQYHTDARALAWALLLSLEEPINQAEIDANTDPETEIFPVYRRPWANIDHRHSIDDIQGLTARLEGTVQATDSAINYPSLVTPLYKHGTFDLTDGVLTLDLSSGNQFYVKLRENITSVVLDRGSREAPPSGSTELFDLYVQQTSTGDTDRTIAFGSSFLFPNATVVQPTTGADAVTVYKLRKSTAQTKVYVEVAPGYPADEGDVDPTPAGNGNLPYNGQFYGSGSFVTRIGNILVKAGQIAASSFFAYREGTITKIGHHNRLNPTKIYDTDGSTNEGYGNGLCNAYIEVRPLTAAGLPDMGTLLGKTATFVPRDDFALNAHVEIPLEAGIAIPKGGKWLAFVYRMTDTSSSASNGDKYDHSYSMNCNIRQKPTAVKRSPFWGDMKAWTSTNSGSTFKEFKTSYTAEELRGTHAWSGECIYSDGRAIGLGYWYGDMVPKLIDGTNNKCRQIFKMPAAQTFVAKGVHVNLFALGTAQSITLTISIFGGAVQKTVTIPASAIANFKAAADAGYSASRILHGWGHPTLSKDSNGTTYEAHPSPETRAPHEFKYVAFDTNLTLSAGVKYEALFTAPSGAKVYIQGAYNGVKGGQYNSQDTFGGDKTNTIAQFMTNGSTWTDLSASSGAAPNWDFPLLFAAA